MKSNLTAAIRSLNSEFGGSLTKAQKMGLVIIEAEYLRLRQDNTAILPESLLQMAAGIFLGQQKRKTAIDVWFDAAELQQPDSQFAGFAVAVGSAVDAMLDLVAELLG